MLSRGRSLPVSRSLSSLSSLYRRAMSPSKPLVAVGSPELELRHVLLFHRHGDRTPTALSAELGSKVPFTEDEKDFWRSKIATDAQLEALNGVARVVGAGMVSHRPRHIDWPSGTLTMQGVEQMAVKGRTLRRRYAAFIDRWLGGEGTKVEDQVYVLSSSVPRCVISVQSLLRGMFEEVLVDSQTPPFVINTYVKNVLSPTHPLQVFNEIEEIVMDDVAKRSAEDREATEWLKRHVRECLGVPDDKPTPWTVVRDMLACRKAHDMPYPEGISEADAELIHQYDTWLWHVLFSRQDFCFTTFRDGVNEVYSHLKRIVEGQSDEPRLGIFSAHDNSIGALIGALQLQIGGTLPEYGSVVAFEVYRDSNTGQHYISALFEDKQVAFAGHEHELLCPFSHFETIALNFLDDKNYA